MTVDDLDHVAYLGAFVVAGKLYRGDLYRDDKARYWADHSLTEPDGSWVSALHRVHANNPDAAATAALSGILEYLSLQGDDVSFMTIVHYAPSMKNMSAAASALPAQFH
jgi:hypothetical protein